MSAFRVGADVTQKLAPRAQSFQFQHAELTAVPQGGQVTATATTAPQNDAQSTADLVQKAADIYTKWIPGDALAIFVALTAAFRGTITTGGLTPHAWGLLVVGLASAGGLTLLGALSANLSAADVAHRAKVPEIAIRVVLAGLAFGFWSLTVPGAWWEVKGWNAGILAAVSFAISIGFALVAEISVTYFKSKFA